MLMNNKDKKSCNLPVGRLRGMKLKSLEINLEPLCNRGLCDDVTTTLLMEDI